MGPGTAVPSCPGLGDLEQECPARRAPLPPPAPFGDSSGSPAGPSTVWQVRTEASGCISRSLCPASDQLLNFLSLAVPPSSVKWGQHDQGCCEDAACTWRGGALSESAAVRAFLLSISPALSLPPCSPSPSPHARGPMALRCRIPPPGLPGSYMASLPFFTSMKSVWTTWEYK